MSSILKEISGKRHGPEVIEVLKGKLDAFFSLFLFLLQDLNERYDLYCCDFATSFLETSFHFTSLIGSEVFLKTY